MTMSKRNARRTMSAASFKAECLALLDAVRDSGEEVIVTKRGVPVARLVAIRATSAKPLKGSVTVLDDLIAPIDVKWDAEA